MFRRRIAAACACALLFVVPAAANAAPIQDPSPATATTPQGDTKFDLQPQPTGSRADAVQGDTKFDLQPQPTNAPVGDTKNDLPSSAPTPTVVPVPAAPAAPAVTTTDDGTDGWLIAAIVEGALLAAIAIAIAVIVSGRRRRTLHAGV
jgi:hypothetical protein